MFLSEVYRRDLSPTFISKKNYCKTETGKEYRLNNFFALHSSSTLFLIQNSSEKVYTSVENRNRLSAPKTSIVVKLCNIKELKLVYMPRFVELACDRVLCVENF